jgi:(p)ppGpp synthase/HD superfamily hydrolase
MSLLKKALYFAAKAHEGQTRKYGWLNLDPIPYILHPVSVAARAAEYGLPLEVQAAAYLHDVIEDTVYGEDELRKEFPAYVVDLVVELTNSSHSEAHKTKSRSERKRIDREHLAKASVYGKLLKMIDRMDNLEDMGEATPSFKKLYLEESKALAQALCKDQPKALALSIQDDLAQAIVQLEAML